MQSRENFDVVSEDPPGTHRATAGTALLESIHKLQLTHVSHGTARDDKHQFVIERNQNASEHAGVDAGRTRTGDLHLKRPTGNLRFGDYLAYLKTAGAQINGQFWGRDSNSSVLLSNALEYTVCP